MERLNSNDSGCHCIVSSTFVAKLAVKTANNVEYKLSSLIVNRGAYWQDRWQIDLDVIADQYEAYVVREVSSNN